MRIYVQTVRRSVHHTARSNAVRRIVGYGEDQQQVRCHNVYIRFVSSLIAFRYVLSNTTELHARIDRMTRRIRELEYGLGQLQSSVSNETHELLRDDHPLKDTSVAAAVAASKSGGMSPELPIPGSASGSSSSGASPPEAPSSAVDSTDDEFIDSFGGWRADTARDRLSSFPSRRHT